MKYRLEQKHELLTVQDRRPYCLYCGAILEEVGEVIDGIRYVTGYGYEGNGLFCCLKHGYQYSVQNFGERK